MYCTKTDRAKYRNYGKYSTLPTFISQGIYDNNGRFFVEIPTVFLHDVGPCAFASDR